MQTPARCVLPLLRCVLTSLRPSDRVTAAVDAIRAAAPAALVTVIDCDLLDLDSVRAAATKVSQRAVSED
jgi:hypothetical protein